MKKLIFLFIVFTQLVNAQITKKLSDFTKVSSFDQIYVFLIPSDENKIEISGSHAESVELVYENNELKIRMPLDKLLKGNDILAKVYYTKLEAVEANGGSSIGNYSSISSINFDILAKEASTIKLKFDAKKVVARVTQGSTIEISGKTDNLDIVANAGSLFKSENCQVSQAVVSVNAGGKANVNASEFVDAKVRAGGVITIYGNPKQVAKKTILGGDIIVKNDPKSHIN